MMNSTLPALRDFVPDDADAVVRLWTDCGLTRPWNDPHKDIQRKLADRNGSFWVAEDPSGAIMAAVMIGYDGHRGTINYLAVAEAWRRSGFGVHIMAQAEAFLIAQGCPKVSFCVRKDNAAVLAFYDGLGYQADDVHFLGKRLIVDD